MLEIKCVYHLLTYVDVKILGGSVHTKKEFTESLIVASKEFGPEVIADKLSTWTCIDIRMQGRVKI